MECPLCYKPFSDDFIAAHAASCGGPSQSGPAPAPKQTKQSTLSWGGASRGAAASEVGAGAGAGAAAAVLSSSQSGKRRRVDGGAGSLWGSHGAGSSGRAGVAMQGGTKRVPPPAVVVDDDDDDAFLLAAEASLMEQASSTSGGGGGGGGGGFAASPRSVKVVEGAHSPTTWSTRGRPLDPRQEPINLRQSPATKSPAAGRSLMQHDGNMFVSPTKWSASQAAAGKENQCDLRYPQFNHAAGKRWIYPTNLPERSYQLSIIERSLFANTLVVLPTGLGKTFIAAVVMYNLYKWYPTGKLVFMAPTKPLVNQQLDACHNIMGFDPDDLSPALTGKVSSERRAELWRRQRVFFLTPQVLQNDLAAGICPAEQIVCLVADEAHKASGNSPYVVVVDQIRQANPFFRILALSATPGDNAQRAQEVVTNLLIAHIELRNDEALDVRQYVHTRRIDVVVCKLNELYCRIKSELDAVMETTASRLVHRTKGALYIKAANKLGAFLVMQARKSYQQQSGSQDQPDYRQNMADFFFLENVCRKAAQFETDGINALYQGCLDDSRTKLSSDLAKSPQFKKIFVEIAALVTGPPVVDGLDAGTPPQLPAWRHPKFAKIVTLLADHFEQHGAETRAIVFVNFRNTVGDLVEVIRACCPKATPEEFVGQASSGKGKGSKGLKQADQLRLLEDFKAGRCNTIVATSVAEEGLDIGEVDLIICFDAHGSAIRLVQRMGRTGRKRDGKVVLLVTEGKEEQKHKDSTSKTKKMFKTLVNAAKKFTTYKENPRMVPVGLNPQIERMHVVARARTDGSKLKAARKPKATAFLTASQSVDFTAHYRASTQSQVTGVDITAHPLCQMVSTPTLIASHSHRSKTLVHLMRRIHLEDGDDVQAVTDAHDAHLCLEDVWTHPRKQGARSPEHPSQPTLHGVLGGAAATSASNARQQSKKKRSRVPLESVDFAKLMDFGDVDDGSDSDDDLPCPYGVGSNGQPPQASAASVTNRADPARLRFPACNVSKQRNSAAKARPESGQSHTVIGSAVLAAGAPSSNVFDDYDGVPPDFDNPFVEPPSHATTHPTPGKRRKPPATLHKGPQSPPPKRIRVGRVLVEREWSPVPPPPDLTMLLAALDHQVHCPHIISTETATATAAMASTSATAPSRTGSHPPDEHDVHAIAVDPAPMAAATTAARHPANQNVTIAESPSAPLISSMPDEIPVSPAAACSAGAQGTTPAAAVQMDLQHSGALLPSTVVGEHDALLLMDLSGVFDSSSDEQPDDDSVVGQTASSMKPHCVDSVASESDDVAIICVDNDEPASSTAHDVPLDSPVVAQNVDMGSQTRHASPNRMDDAHARVEPLKPTVTVTSPTTGRDSDGSSTDDVLQRRRRTTAVRHVISSLESSAGPKTPKTRKCRNDGKGQPPSCLVNDSSDDDSPSQIVGAKKHINSRLKRGGRLQRVISDDESQSPTKAAHSSTLAHDPTCAEDSLQLPASRSTSNRMSRDASESDDDADDFKRPAAKPFQGTQHRREPPRARQQKEKSRPSRRRQRETFADKEASCDEMSGSDEDGGPLGESDYSQNSFIDDGTPSSVASSSMARSGGAPSTSPRSGHRRRRREKDSPKMMSIYQTSLLSQGDNPIFKERPRYGGNRQKMVFGKNTPSPPSSLEDGGTTYDNPYSPRMNEAVSDAYRERVAAKRATEDIPFDVFHAVLAGDSVAAAGDDGNRDGGSQGMGYATEPPFASSSTAIGASGLGTETPNTHSTAANFDLGIADILEDESDDTDDDTNSTVVVKGQPTASTTTATTLPPNGATVAQTATDASKSCSAVDFDHALHSMLEDDSDDADDFNDPPVKAASATKSLSLARKRRGVKKHPVSSKTSAAPVTTAVRSVAVALPMGDGAGEAQTRTDPPDTAASKGHSDAVLALGLQSMQNESDDADDFNDPHPPIRRKIAPASTAALSNDAAEAQTARACPPLDLSLLDDSEEEVPRSEPEVRFSGVVFASKTAIRNHVRTLGLLRNTHGVRVDSVDSKYAHFVLSCRLAVDVLTQQAVTEKTTREQILNLSQEYNRAYVIIENFKVKRQGMSKHHAAAAAAGALGHGTLAENRKYVSAITTMARFRVNLLFSESYEQTAALLNSLREAEDAKGFGLRSDSAACAQAKRFHPVLQHVPGLNLACTHSLVSGPNALSSLADMINADTARLEAAAPGLPPKKSAKLRKFFRHSYNPP